MTAEHSARWRTANPRSDWGQRLKYRFGITVEQYEELLERQSGGCALCGAPACQTGRRLAVDHDQTCCPGRKSCGACVRGLLCMKCNTWLDTYVKGTKFMTPDQYLGAGPAFPKGA